ncbi:hypothetical protein [Aequorivita antarctica]|uniref:Uncharacterized protein n=1 Tax=Aequorivita antarctica TaxID=153266 RepID=A0A5C6Z557_9FLAO|nr:hypothetical protein [Aequorivita antarctica]TXD74830.1 hypothetical protein ESU54_01155 [Aequorivita antarctica]SRX72465.1 hypothetical protein AEQU3_00287 [Aequorivita antarctica]
MFLRIIFFSTFCIFSTVAQTSFLTIPNDLKTRNKSPKDAFAVVDDENNTFAIFLDDDKTLNGYLYSEDLKPIGKFASNGLPKIYTEIIGQTLKNGQIRLFLKNANNRNFGSVLFDFEREATIETEYGFKLNDEIFLQSHSFKDKFYILTVTRRSSILNIYTFDHDGKFGKKEFDFSDKFFGDMRNDRTRLDQLLTERSQFKTEGTVVKIEESNPNNIAITSNVCKVYDRGETFILTIDEGMLYTYIFEFVVPNLTVSLKAIEKEQLPLKGILASSNSYLYEDKIFQISGLNDTLVFTVKNIETKEELKRIELSKDEEITFKNSPIIQEGTSISSDGRRELEKTAQFLRKITSEDIGVAVIKSKSGYQVTMGGNKEIQQTGGGAPMMMGGFGGGMPIGTAGAFTVSYNPVFYAFNSYKHNKSTRIECVFNDSFEHVDGIVPVNVFDKIRTYTLRNPNGKAENVFKMNDFFIYGKYNSKEDTYELFKFSE